MTKEEKHTTLDTDQCKWWVITLFSMAKSLACQTNNFDNAKEIQSAQDKIIKALERYDDSVSLGTYKQVAWERDIVIEQLKELGYSFGEKIRTSEDCVSRQAVLAIAGDSCLDLDNYEDTKEFCDAINELPSVTPTRCIAEIKFSKDDLREICNERIEVECTHGTCKDCKHWKDSDGVYRRGVGAESKCPINIKEVYEGNFYCKWFEKRGSENEVD